MPRRGPRTWLLALPLLLPASWWAATSGVRGWVNVQLAATHGRLLDRPLRDTAGHEWGPAELRGKTVVLAFFRSRCESCRAEREAIVALAGALDPQRAVLLSVMMDAVEGYPQDETARTLATLGYRHPVVMADAALVDAFHGSRWAHVTPVTYVLDGDGRVVTHLRGHQPLATLAAALPADALRR